MDRARIFGMVTTENSTEYTDYALESFFTHTELRSQDRFILYDNDESYNGEIWKRYPQVELIKNSTPKSFAENINQGVLEANTQSGDLYFLNNDIIFTPNWLTPLLDSRPVILSPLGNQQVQHRTENFLWKNQLSLDDYRKHREEFDNLVNTLPRNSEEFLSVLVLGFFSVKIPYEVYSKVGLFHTSFGRGGAEDTDYCLRAILSGFSIEYAVNSYILHFNQRSTGAVEESGEKTAREKQYREVFKARWGESLLRLAIGYDQSVLEEHSLIEEAKRGDYRAITLALLVRDGKEIPVNERL